MNESLISLISIFIGIISANLFGYFYKNYSFKLLGNTIVGVFGSVFFTKLIGRFVNPFLIVNKNDVNVKLLVIYLVISIIGAIIFQIIIKKITQKTNAN